MSDNFIYNFSYDIMELDILFIDEFGKLILSKNITKCLMSDKYQIYMQAIQIYPLDIPNLILSIKPIKLLSYYYDYLILLDDGCVVYISTNKGFDKSLSIQIFSEYKQLIQIVGITDIFTIYNGLGAMTNTNSIIFFNGGMKIIEMNGKCVKCNTCVACLLNKNTYMLHNLSNLEKTEMCVPKPILNLYLTNIYIIILYEDFSLDVIQNPICLGKNKLSFTIIECDLDGMYVLITCNLHTKIYHILKNGEISENLVSYYTNISKHTVFFRLYDFNHMEILYSKQNESAGIKNLLDFMNNDDHLYMFYSNNIMVVVYQNRSFKLFKCDDEFTSILEMTNPEIFDMSIECYKLLSNSWGAYI